MPTMSPFEIVLSMLALYMLYFPIAGVIVSAVQIHRRPKPRARGAVVEIWLRNYMMFVVGLPSLVNFIYHTAFAQFTATLIGWANSPFQIEVGTASLGMGLAGVLAAVRPNFWVRVVAWLAIAPFLWGAAVGHVIDIIRTQNFAPGNAGFVLWLDILLPAIGLVLLVLARRHPVAGADAEISAPARRATV